jgi:serine/threonine protein kinase
MKNYSSCNEKLFVLKPVSRSIFDHLQEFKAEFSNNPRLRIHVDHNEDENVLVYEYFKSDLLSLVENYPALPIEARKTILKEVGLGLNDIHMKHWIHLGMIPCIVTYDPRLTHPCPDVKPNNIFLNWYVDEKDQFQLGKVALGDMDCALKLQGQKLLNQKVGNVMWRSPEGQLGKGVGKPSEVFSFALLVSQPFDMAVVTLLMVVSSVSTLSPACNVFTQTLRNLRKLRLSLSS